MFPWDAEQGPSRVRLSWLLSDLPSAVKWECGDHSQIVHKHAGLCKGTWNM